MDIFNLVNQETEKDIKSAINTSEVYFSSSLPLTIGKEIGSFLSEAIDVLVDSIFGEEEKK